ncbi:MAG TPA: ATP-binding protein, partial [Myxococcota bacterium]|nr:ATP-binding protein [Myxococcota bacterium]
TAGASHIDVYFQRPVRREPTELFLGKLSFPGGYIAFTDDGRGMDRATLVEAMKFGSQRDYGARDLGRFGIGLKAASFSQARCLTVASRTASSDITVLRWDRDHVEATGRWEVLQPQLNEAEREVLLEPLAERAGTVVLWTKLRPRVATERRGKRVDGPDGGYGRAMEDLVLHLGMVFHRFLTGTTRSQRRVAISMNCNDIPAWDPFLREHGDTQQSTAFSELVPCPGTDRQYPVTLEAWILPHTKMLSPAEKERAGQYGRWNELQGFYIYRADRIIQAGGWCDLWTPEEHKKLLRVALDFDPELDAAFDVHAAKMSVTLPVPLAERLDKKLQDARRDADTRFRKEGKEEKPAPVKVVGGGSSPPMSAVPAPAAPSAKPADPAPA